MYIATNHYFIHMCEFCIFPSLTIFLVSNCKSITWSSAVFFIWIFYRYTLHFKYCNYVYTYIYLHLAIAYYMSLTG